MSERGSRLECSVLTFGLRGRLLCTVVLFGLPVWLLLYAGLFGLMGAMVWTGWVLPRALRDVWRPADLPSSDRTRLRDGAARDAARRQGPAGSHPVFNQDSRFPTRW